MALCGNGVVDAGETCDAGCPTACPTAAACRAGELVSGGTCRDECVYWDLVAPVPGDGCCPPGATHETDEDCPAEACADAPAAAEDDDDPCTVDVLVGAGSLCPQTEHQPITSCVGGDGCAPAGCNAAAYAAFASPKILVNHVGKPPNNAGRTSGPASEVAEGRGLAKEGPKWLPHATW